MELVEMFGMKHNAQYRTRSQNFMYVITAHSTSEITKPRKSILFSSALIQLRVMGYCSLSQLTQSETHFKQMVWVFGETLPTSGKTKHHCSFKEVDALHGYPACSWFKMQHWHFLLLWRIKTTSPFNSSLSTSEVPKLFWSIFNSWTSLHLQRS